MKRVRSMTVINSVDSQFKSIKPMSDIDANFILLGDLIEFTKYSDDISIIDNNSQNSEILDIDNNEKSTVYLCEPSVIMTNCESDSNHTYNLLPNNIMHDMCYGYFKNDNLVLNNENILTINMDVASTCYTGVYFNEPILNNASLTKYQIASYVSDAKKYPYFSQNFEPKPSIPGYLQSGDNVRFYRNLLNFPSLTIMFTDKDLSTLNQRELTSYILNIDGQNIFIKHFTPIFDNSYINFEKLGKAYLYKIKGTNSKFDNVTCYTENSEFYSGSTNADNLSNVDAFKNLDEWSSYGMMYVVLKNEGNDKIPFNLTLAKRKTRIDENGKLVVYADIIREYPMYKVTSLNTDINSMYCMCERNVKAVPKDPVDPNDLPYRYYEYKNDEAVQFINCSCSVDIKDLIFKLARVSNNSNPEEALKKMRFTYFFISPIGNTFDISEMLSVLHDGNYFVTQSFNRGGITQISPFDGIVDELDNSKYHGPNINTNNRFLVVNDNTNNNNVISGEFFGYINNDVISHDITDDNPDKMHDKYNKRPSFFLKNINLTTTGILEKTFNESYRSGKRLHYKKDGSVCETPEITIRNYIAKNRPDAIYCIGDGNSSGLFANVNNHISKRTHKRRLISNRDVDILRANFPPISLIHYEGTYSTEPIKKYYNYIRNWQKNNPGETFTNYDIVDRYGFENLKYFTNYLFLNVDTFNNILQRYYREVNPASYDKTVNDFSNDLDYSIYNGSINDDTITGKNNKLKIKTIRQPLLILLWNNSLHFAIDNMLKGIVCGNVYLTTSQVFSHMGILLTEKEMLQANLTLCNVIAKTLLVDDEKIYLELNFCVDSHKCLGNDCELVNQCYDVCNQYAIEPDADGKAYITDLCILCGACVSQCDVHAIGWSKISEKLMKYKYLLGNVPMLYKKAGLKVDIYTNSSLTDLLLRVIKHNMKQIYLIKGYGKVSIPLENDDRVSIDSYKFKITNPNKAAFNKIVIATNKPGIYTTPIKNPKFKKITYNNYHKNSKTEKLENNTIYKFKFDVGIDDTWVANLFDHNYIDNNILVVKENTLYNSYIKEKSIKPQSGNITLTLNFNDGFDLGNALFRTITNCKTAEYVNRYLREPLLLKENYQLVGWSSLQINPTDIKPFDKLKILNSDTEYFAVWKKLNDM